MFVDLGETKSDVRPEGAGEEIDILLHQTDPAPQIRSVGLRPDYLQTPGADDIVHPWLTLQPNTAS